MRKMRKITFGMFQKLSKLPKCATFQVVSTTSRCAQIFFGVSFWLLAWVFSAFWCQFWQHRIWKRRTTAQSRFFTYWPRFSRCGLEIHMRDTSYHGYITGHVTLFFAPLCLFTGWNPNFSQSWLCSPYGKVLVFITFLSEILCAW